MMLFFLLLPSLLLFHFHFLPHLHLHLPPHPLLLLISFHPLLKLSTNPLNNQILPKPTLRNIHARNGTFFITFPNPIADGLSFVGVAIDGDDGFDEELMGYWAA